MDFANARFHSKGKVGKGHTGLWMFRCKNRERRGVKCNGWVKVRYRLVANKPNFNIRSDLVRTRPHDKGCEFFNTNQLLARQPTCTYTGPNDQHETDSEDSPKSVSQPDESSSQADDTASSPDSETFSSINSEVDSVSFKLDDISQALNRGSIGDDEKLALKIKMERCKEKFESLRTLLNNLSADAAGKPEDSSNAIQMTLRDLSVKLYTQLYTNLLLNLFSNQNAPLLKGSSHLASTCSAFDSSTSTKMASTEMASTEIASTKMASTEITTTKIASTGVTSAEMANTEMASTEITSTEIASQDSADDCCLLSDSSDSKTISPDSDADECSDPFDFTLAFEDEYKRRIESFEPFKSADETGGAKRQNPSPSDVPNKRLRGDCLG